MAAASAAVRGAAVAAVEAHIRLWNNGDRVGWLRLFADDVTFDDPVGAPTKQGRVAAEQSWDRSQPTAVALDPYFHPS